MNYPFGIQFILLLSMPKNSQAELVVNSFTPDCSVRLYVLQSSSAVKKTRENFKNIETKAKKSQI